MDYTKTNAEAIDRWVEEGWEYGTPVSKEKCKKARQGDWNVELTPTRCVPKNWFPSLSGKQLLGLACGGGQQMPIFALLGADCTVLDISEKQLENERLVAEREGYKINIIKADMTERLPFEDCTFDIIFHPVSNVYIEDVYPLWRECYRVLKRGGILLSGLDNGMNFLFDGCTGKPLTAANKLPYNQLKNPEQMAKAKANGDDTLQFSHTFDEQIGGQLKAGFVITDAYEDYESETSSDEGQLLNEYGISTYWATKAVKP